MVHLGCAAGQINAVTINIRCQFGRSSLQNHLYIIDNRIEMLFQGLIHHFCGDLTFYRKTGHNISAVYDGTLALFFQFFQGNLYIFRCLATDDQ